MSPADVLPPRRLDPRTIIVRALRGSPSLILAVPAILAWSRGDGASVGFLAAGMALLLVVLVVSSWLRWWTFTYQVLPGQLVIAHGLIQRTRRSIPAERIQDVSITQGPLSRLIGLAEVRVETGGGESDEGLLRSVSLSEAHRLRGVLRSIRANGGLAGAAVPEDVETGETLFRMGLPRLLFSGLFNFSLVWIAAIFGALQYLDQALGYERDMWLDLFGAAERELQSRLNTTVVIGLAGLAIALGLVAGVVRTVLRDYGFTLTHVEGRFRYRRGLLTRTEVVVAKRQIQLGLVERGTVSGRLGWYALKVQTLGGGDQASGRQELAPFARAAELDPLIALAGLPPFDPAGLRPVARGHGFSGLIGTALMSAIILLAAATVFPPAALLLLAMPLALAVALLRPGRHRYALAETSVQVTRGVLTRRDWTVPYANVQTVTVRRGPLQRWLGLATVRIDTAGGRGMHGPHVHDVEPAQAAAFVGELVARVVMTGPPSSSSA
jgi:putative membrane protein